MIYQLFKELEKRLQKNRFLKVIAFLLIPVWVVIGAPIALILLILFAMPLLVLNYITTNLFGIEILNDPINPIIAGICASFLIGFWKVFLVSKLGIRLIGKKVETENVSVIEEYKNKSKKRSEVDVTKESIHMNDNSIILKCNVCNSENKLNISYLNSNTKFCCHKCKNEFPTLNSTRNGKVENSEKTKLNSLAGWITSLTIIIILLVLLVGKFYIDSRKPNQGVKCNIITNFLDRSIVDGVDCRNY